MKKLFAGLFIILMSALSVFALEYTEVRAEHILVKTKAEAEIIENKIQNGEAFEKLAEEYSLCPSKRNGGDLGYFTRGQMVPEFEKAAFEMAIGEISEPVQTQFGWHIIKILDKRGK